MNLWQLLAILRSRIGWIVPCLALTIGAALAVNIYWPPTYTATTAVVIAFKTSDPFDKNGTAESLLPGYLATQIDIATSHPVARRVIETLKLDDDASLREEFRRYGQRGDMRDWLAKKLLKNLHVQPARESRVVEFHFSAPEARFAANVANAFTQAYLETNLKLNVSPAQRNSAWLEQQAKVQREALERAQRKLTTYQQRHGIVGDADRLDLETQRMADLSAQLITAQAQRYDAQARQLGVNHPQYQAAASQEASLRRSLADQKSKVLHLRQAYDQMDMLKREVENAQHAYGTMLQSLNQTSLEGQFDQANVSVLSPAMVPVAPSFPRPKFDLFIGAVVGLILGVGMALLREISDRRIRTVRDIEADLGLPVFGQLLKGD
ncbi:MAG: hypothetical protein HY308_06375 [Gammaproteobacteria bacterium]|nr:hypothetical protein [Gammaproteobacteria bacterium]